MTFRLIAGELLLLTYGFAQQTSHLERGAALMRGNNLEQAQREFSEAVKDDPKSYRAFVNLGIVNAQLQRLAEAESALRKAIELNPASASAHYNLALVLSQTGKSREATTELEAAVRIAPQNLNAQFNLGSALVSSGNARAAIEHFEKAAAMAPEPAILLQLARAQAQAGLFLDALNTTLQISSDRLPPAERPAFLLLQARLYQKAGHPDGAVPVLESAAKLDPHSAEISYSLGFSHYVLEYKSKISVTQAVPYGAQVRRRRSATHPPHFRYNGFVHRHYRWSVVGMLWWIALFNYADRQAIFSVFPLLEREMHLSQVQLGLLGSSFAWVYGLCAPFAGNIVDRVRRKTAILTGLESWSLICMAAALSRNFTHLLFFRAAEGLGETVYFPASMSMISDYHGKATRSRAMGIHQSSVYIGTIVGGFFAGFIGQRYGWRWSFVVFGALGMALGWVLHRFLKEPARGAADFEDLGDGTPLARPHLPLISFLKIIWGTPTVLLLMLGFMCANFMATVLFTWMPAFVYGKFHLSLAMAGFTATVYIQLASMFGSPLGGWLADILRKQTPGGRIIVQAVALFLEAPFAAWCALTGSMFWLAVSLSLWGLAKGFYEANIFASVFDVIRPEARGTAAGFMNLVGWLAGGSTAPVLIGYLAQHTSLEAAIAKASLCYVIAGALLTAAIVFFVKRDAGKLESELRAEAGGS